MQRIILRTLAGAAIVTALQPMPVLADKAPIYTGTFSNAALEGHDPVAYFTEGRPVEGARSYSLEWRGADWYFASAENLEAFRVDPERYAPQFGGYCAYGVAVGNTVRGDPELWTIHEGKLYVNIDQSVQDIWVKDVPGYIADAEANWPAVLK